MAREAADSYTCVGCTGWLHMRMLSSKSALACASLAGLRGGKDSPQGSDVGDPKQQPASKQPIRPNARPIGTAKPAMSAAFQNGNRSRRKRTTAAADAPTKPP